METFELLRVVHEACERIGIRYLTVGSMATIMFGEPRLTLDVDVLLDIQPAQVDDFCDAFPAPVYYLSKPAVLQAIRTRSQFNIIHTTAALKVDCILPDGTPHSISEMGRGMLRPTPAGFDARFASPEDVMLKKMEYFRLGESDKHLSDCARVLRVSGKIVDREYIDRWATVLELNEIWQTIKMRADAAAK
jgi:hypothetical protein